MHTMEFDDRPDPAKRLEQARKARGFATSKDAARYFSWKYDTYAQHENGTRGIIRQAEKYADAFHVSAAWLLTGEGTGPGESKRVPLKGRVGAGAEIYTIEDGGDETVEAPAEADGATIAVEVVGDSMFPAYENGTILYYSKLLPPGAMINRRCVVKLANEKIFVKVLRAGSAPDVWTLQSLNPLYPDMVDQIIEWVAPIDWIKPH